MFLLVCLLLGTCGRRYWGGFIQTVHYKSRESHLQVGRVSWPRDHQCAQLFTDPEPSLSRRDVESQRRDVSTSRLLNVATFKRRDV